MTATAPAPGSLAWFEVATDDPERAEKFYGGLFDWSFADDGPVSESMDYRRITAAGSSAPMGGLFATGGRLPGHAVFSIVVADVAETCAQAEALGGSVVSRHLDVAPGVPTFAYLRDPDGQLFGIFAPPA